MEGKEKRVEEKEVEKREKGKKWFWEKSFLFLFDCVFASSLFSLHPPHHHATTHAHTTHAHPSPIIHHATRRLVHTITCKQGRVLCCLLGVDSKTHTASSTPTLHHLTSHNTHQPTQHRHSSWCKQQRNANGQ